MTTAQKIRTQPYEAQGLFEPEGEPEPLEGWLEAYGDAVSLVEAGLRGCWPYTVVAKLDEELGTAYYLLPLWPAVTPRVTPAHLALQSHGNASVTGGNSAK